MIARFLILCFIAWLASPLEARAQPPASCSTVGQNLFVRDRMNDIYFWYREIPFVNPSDFDSPEAYLEAIRYRPLDSRFSYITSRAANDAFFSDSQFIGFGFQQSTSDTEMRILQVYPDSPAEEAGLARGHRIVEINGRSVRDLVASGEIGGAFGPSEIGVQASIVFQDQAGRRINAQMTKRLVTIPTVAVTNVHNIAGRRMGYILFQNFVRPSVAALDAAFNELIEAGATELVLDLRYNGGGLVSVAQHLASLIGGTRTAGQVLAEYFHNDKNAFRNTIIRFESKPNALRLERVVVITTRQSASASELVINALRPFIPVLVVGERTYGKPVGQYPYNFCDKVLAPVSFTLRNASGEGDFFDGFAPDCAAADDIEHQLGDAREASLREAITLVDTGACSARAITAQRERVEPRWRATGWQSLVNAY
jgi:C-terminal peptidase prc